VQAATELGVGSNEFSSLVTILPETRTNSVVVSGTVDDIRLLTELVKKIDILLAQVRLEVIVAEVTLTENHSTGISQLGLVVSGDKLVGFSGGGPGFNVANGQITRSADVISGLRDFAGSLNLTSNSSDNGRSNVSILSQPTIVTTHNKPASIFVGQSLPIITGTQRTPVGTTGTTVDSGFSSSSTVSYRDIGIRLEVTPLIGGDGSVQLEIAQTVEDVIDNVTIDVNEQPVIGQRETESFISVRDGEIIVLGGIQRTRQDRSRSRLGPIPIIGDLLGTRRRGETRTDLVFFLRPTILDNSAADNEATLRQIDALPNSDQIRRVITPDEFAAEESTSPARPLTRPGPRN
jgi:general secretion pathway protein D